MLRNIESGKSNSPEDPEFKIGFDIRTKTCQTFGLLDTKFDIPRLSRHFEIKIIKLISINNNIYYSIICPCGDYINEKCHR